MRNGTATRVRRDVQSLLAEGEEGRRVLDDYARAITLMRARDDESGEPTDPLGWRFQAAIHGFPGLDPTLDHENLWGSCRHNSWFFLPWHRLYLLAFERIVQFHLEDDTWSLPYWDYTKPDDESSRILPEPFRVPPEDDNALYTEERHPAINHPSRPTPVPFERATAAAALAADVFARTGDEPEKTFAGGIVEDVAPVMSARGSLEGTPHGWVHGVVGGGGLMSGFDTAALDPIFWLHHANIDRLWDVWIKEWGAEAMPTSDAWLDTSFEFFGLDGMREERPIRDILVSEELGYVYESTDLPGPLPGPAPAPEEAIVMPPKLVGAASEIPFSSRTAVDIELSAPSEGLSLNEAASPETPARWYLRVEDIVGERPEVPGYDVYVNLPESESADNHPELRAGGIASFGIPEASRPKAEHGGSGLTDVFEITELVGRLFGDEAWDPSALKVTVVPAGVTGEAEEGGDVRAGRISVYAG